MEDKDLNFKIEVLIASHSVLALYSLTKGLNEEKKRDNQNNQLDYKIQTNYSQSSQYT